MVGTDDAESRCPWTDYTRAHNANGNTWGVEPVGCALGRSTCASFVAFVLDGAVLSIPLITAPIAGATLTVPLTRTSITVVK